MMRFFSGLMTSAGSKLAASEFASSDGGGVADVVGAGVGVDAGYGYHVDEPVGHIRLQRYPRRHVKCRCRRASTVRVGLRPSPADS